MMDDTTMAVPALAVPIEGLGELVRTAVGAALEAALEAELTAALGRAAWERAVAVPGFRRTWGPKWSAVVVSLDEAGAGLTAFTAFPPAQWKSLRTTNAIERIFSEFRRRVKTQGALPTPDAILTLLWGILATGGIRLRKLDGYQTITATTRRQAA